MLCSRIHVVAMTGATISIEDASAEDCVWEIKQLVYEHNRKMPAHLQRLMYRPGPYGIDPLPDNETLGGAGVAQDWSAELDVLLVEMTEAEIVVLNSKVILMSSCSFNCIITDRIMRRCPFVQLLVVVASVQRPIPINCNVILLLFIAPAYGCC